MFIKETASPLTLTASPSVFLTRSLCFYYPLYLRNSDLLFCRNQEGAVSILINRFTYQCHNGLVTAFHIF